MTDRTQPTEAQGDAAIMRLERHFEAGADDGGKTVLRAFSAQVKVVLTAQAKLNDQLWCHALLYPATESGFEDQGPLETRKELIRKSPLMESVTQRMFDDGVEVGIRKVASATANPTQQPVKAQGDGHEPIVCYLKASNGERRWIGCSCGANTETVSPDPHWYASHVVGEREKLAALHLDILDYGQRIAVLTAAIAALKASHADERERMIRHYDEVIERDGVKLASQQAEIEALRYVCGEAYQMAGALGGPIEALDNLAAASTGKVMSLPHESFLPIHPRSPVPNVTNSQPNDFSREASEQGDSARVISEAAHLAELDFAKIIEVREVRIQEVEAFRQLVIDRMAIVVINQRNTGHDMHQMIIAYEVVQRFADQRLAELKLAVKNDK